VLVQVVQQLTGVRIDHYAEINLYGFYMLTEAIGNVEICLKRDVVDPDSGSDFKAGRQLISGSDALSFVRQRHGLPNGDLDRIVRQQVFMAAVAKKMLSPGVLTNRNTIAELSEALQRTTVIDANWDVMDFAQQLREVATGSVEFTTAPVLDPTHRTEDGKSVVSVDEAQVRAFTAGLLDGRAQPSQSSHSSTSPPSSPPSSTATPTTTGELDGTLTADGITCVN
jgi:anionic cell wall polymer biosynthesis LytR-Cps2A-Psr (LCP) family protein